MRLLPAWRTLASYTEQKENNYLLLRFLAALSVIYGHSYAITKLPGQHDLVQSLLRFSYSGDVGVDVFFVISGFLVTASYLNRRDWGDFMKARVLRIFPALAVCLLVTVLILGPVVSTLGVLDYFGSGATYAYFFRNLSLLLLDYDLPGVFEHLPQYGVNGSLWTLPIEFGLYILLSLFGLLGILFKRRWYGLFILGMCALAFITFTEVHFLSQKMIWFRLMCLFAAGSVMRVYADRIPLTGWPLLLLPLAFLLRRQHLGAFSGVFSVWLVYAVFWAAYVPNLHFFNRLGDYSYGLYIYAFPIQQTLRQYFPDIAPLTLFACASVATVICAALSWHLVEEPALRLKSVDFGKKFARFKRFTPLGSLDP